MALGDATLSAAGFVFPAAQLIGIADDLRSFVPLFRQLVEAQTKLSGNVATLVARLSSDAPRIVELTAANLEREARSGHPDVQIVEQCLRVGAWLMRLAVEAIKAVGYTIAGEYLLHPDETAERILAIAMTMEHFVAKLY